MGGLFRISGSPEVITIYSPTKVGGVEVPAVVEIIVQVRQDPLVVLETLEQAHPPLPLDIILQAATLEMLALLGMAEMVEILGYQEVLDFLISATHAVAPILNAVVAPAAAALRVGDLVEIALVLRKVAVEAEAQAPPTQVRARQGDSLVQAEVPGVAPAGKALILVPTEHPVRVEITLLGVAAVAVVAALLALPIVAAAAVAAAVAVVLAIPAALEVLAGQLRLRPLTTA